MRPPFTVHEFFAVFARYNEAVWPMQLVLLALAFVAVGLAFRGGKVPSRLVSGTLGLLWVWMAVEYHFAQFAIVNPAARAFGVLFLIQAGLILWFGALTDRLAFERPPGLRAVAGWLLLAYGLVAYPVIGILAGHEYLSSPTFGVPCPTTIYTLGLFCFARRPLPASLLVVPILWAAVGSSAALFLRVPQDLGLLAAGLVGVVLAFTMRSQRSSVS
jgi:hypothetical protein